MNDRTITRASRGRVGTIPVEYGPPAAGQKIRFSPIRPDELADIITQAREQRAEEDIASYATRKRTA